MQAPSLKPSRSTLPARSPRPDSDGRLSEHLPWLVHVSPELVLTKDGSLLAAFELEGVDIDEDSSYRLSQAIQDLQDSLGMLDERYYLWMVTDKRLKTNPDEWDGMEENIVTAVIEHQRRQAYESGNVYSLRTTLFVLYTGETGVYAFMENVHRKMADEGQSFVAAFLSSLNPANNTRSAILHDARQLDSNMAIVEDGIASFINAHSVLKFVRLGGWALDSLLNRMANPTIADDAFIEPSPTSMLDATLAASEVRFGRDVYAVHGPDRSLYGCTMSLTGYPASQAALLKVLSVQAEFRLVHVIRCMSYQMGQKVVQENADYYQMTQSTLSQRVVAYLTGQDADVDPGKADLYLQCVEALRRQTAEGLGFSYHSVSLTFLAPKADQAQLLAAAVLRQIGGLPHARERIGLKSAVLSQIPGQWSHNRRLMLANNQLIAHVAPLTTINSGPAQSTHLSDVYGRPTPPLATFTSRLGTEVHFDPYVRQVGHALLVMPTGGGKTTFVNYCLSCFSRYEGAQVIIFDRDHSCRIITHLVGGVHLDMREGLALNPMKHIRDSDLERVQAREFIVRRIEEGGERLNADERKQIYETIGMVAASGSLELSLNTVFSLLPNAIQTKLHEWVDGGPFSYFAGAEDRLSLSDWTCIEMREIMKVDRLSRAFLDHAFTVVSRLLTGRPTFIYVEETSFALNNPAFLAGLDEWLKTFRKKNAFVWMTVQSPESVTGVDVEKIRSTITDNVPNIILGANSRLESHREMYRTFFGMTDEQVSMIGDLRPRRDYLRIAGNICRVLRTDFDEHVLALIRSEPRFQDLLDKHRASGNPNWRQEYLNQCLQPRS